MLCTKHRAEWHAWSSATMPKTPPQIVQIGIPTVESVLAARKQRVDDWYSLIRDQMRSIESICERGGHCSED